ncbi:MAG: tryptophan dimethylallyltransferase family protein, partial [Myxococcota bacterium]
MQRIPAATDVAPTLGSFGAWLLRRLSIGLGFDTADQRRALRWFRRLAEGWAHRSLAERPAWASDITDDHTPFEFSIAMTGGRVELRVLAEAGPFHPTGAVESWQAGMRLHDRIRGEAGVDLERFEAVADL